MGDKAVDQTLVVRDMSMTFGGQRALDNVSMSIRRGEIHGLVGQNGCGKSTLIKILSGYHHPDPGGELEIDGRPVKLPVRTGSASELGLSFVHQDLGLLPSLTVVENFCAWKISTTSEWIIRWNKERKRTEEAFARFGVDIDPRARRRRPAGRPAGSRWPSCGRWTTSTSTQGRRYARRPSGPRRADGLPAARPTGTASSTWSARASRWGRVSSSCRTTSTRPWP